MNMIFFLVTGSRPALRADRGGIADPGERPLSTIINRGVKARVADCVGTPVVAFWANG
jgi:hypothetical protein